MEEPEKLLKKLSRPEKTHKGQNGRVGVIGGSEKYTGAPAISAKSALRTGSDLVEIVTSEHVKNVVAGYSENLIVNSYPSGNLGLSGVEPAIEVIQNLDVSVLGPGLGSPDEEAVRRIVGRAEKPLVIDADAIEPAINSDFGDAIFTPHKSEAEIIEEKFGSIESFVDEKEALVVVKGNKDKIYAPGMVYENITGCSAMTVGGTGDMLTGVIASLISQDLNLKEAARLGCWINGKAGEKAFEKYGKGALATDMVDEIAISMQE
ncbi:MAG: NAD(P)H-hydrate dehydratase [Nanohaloarchaea archaeon]|nr:NAD(P)H-hydrate dehydratase [Candidatus Nanohaloarchaea archaeon]